MSRTQEVKTFAREQGAHLVEIALVERFVEGPVGHRPADLLPGAGAAASASAPWARRTR
jgi:hypothetical protein